MDYRGTCPEEDIGFVRLAEEMDKCPGDCDRCLNLDKCLDEWDGVAELSSRRPLKRNERDKRLKKLENFQPTPKFRSQ